LHTTKYEKLVYFRVVQQAHRIGKMRFKYKIDGFEKFIRSAFNFIYIIIFKIHTTKKSSLSGAFCFMRHY